MLLYTDNRQVYYYDFYHLQFTVIVQSAVNSELRSIVGTLIVNKKQINGLMLISFLRSR